MKSLLENVYFLVPLVLDVSIFYRFRSWTIVQLLYSVFKVQIWQFLCRWQFAVWTHRPSVCESRASHYVLMQAPELTSKLDVQCLPLKRTAHCLVEMVRFELMTPCLQGRCSPNWATPPKFSIHDFSSCILFGVFLFSSDNSQSSTLWMGLNGLEPSTSRLSGVRSNQLSYKPIGLWQPPALPHRLQCSTIGRLSLNHRVRDENGCVP